MLSEILVQADQSPAGMKRLAPARYGVAVKVVHSMAGDINAGNALLSRAADCGATRHILGHMTIPVLLSH